MKNVVTNPQRSADEPLPAGITGTLTVGLNAGNRLLVQSHDDAGLPVGLAPDIALGLAAYLGLRCSFKMFETLAALIEAADIGAWDISFMAPDPMRADRLEFSYPYATLGAAYLVRASSNFTCPADVDQEGSRIVAPHGAAFGLWLERHVTRAGIVWVRDGSEAVQLLADERADAMAGLRGMLEPISTTNAAFRLLDQDFTRIEQTIATPRPPRANLPAINGFIFESLASGTVSRLIAKHRIRGVSAFSSEGS